MEKLILLLCLGCLVVITESEGNKRLLDAHMVDVVCTEDTDQGKVYILDNDTILTVTENQIFVSSQTNNASCK